MNAFRHLEPAGKSLGERVHQRRVGQRPRDGVGIETQHASHYKGTWPAAASGLLQGAQVRYHVRSMSAQPHSRTA